VLDDLLNWLLDGIEGAIALLPTWSPSLPSLDPLAGPLAQVNWLIAIDLPWSIALAILLLGPALLYTTLILWVVGLFTPSSTTR
jgi:hypothetical protein